MELFAQLPIDGDVSTPQSLSTTASPLPRLTHSQRNLLALPQPQPPPPPPPPPRFITSIMFGTRHSVHPLRRAASLSMEERRCQYPSKHCDYHRAVKRNGELHRFCELHREIANRNQRKLDRKRRMKKKRAPDSAPTSPCSEPSSTQPPAPASAPTTPASEQVTPLPELPEPLPFDINPLDLPELDSLFISDSVEPISPEPAPAVPHDLPVVGNGGILDDVEAVNWLVEATIEWGSELETIG